jgi:hypothetical protein
LILIVKPFFRFLATENRVVRNTDVGGHNEPAQGACNCYSCIIEILSTHIEKGSVEITNMSVKCVLDGLRLDPDFEGIFRFHITTHGIAAEARGEVPK